MANTNPAGMSDNTRKRLQWVVMVLAVFLTGQAIYTIVQADENVWTWVSLVCWPIVALAAGYNIWRYSKGESPGRS